MNRRVDAFLLLFNEGVWNCLAEALLPFNEEVGIGRK